MNRNVEWEALFATKPRHNVNAMTSTLVNEPTIRSQITIQNPDTLTLYWLFGQFTSAELAEF